MPDYLFAFFFDDTDQEGVTGLTGTIDISNAVTGASVETGLTPVEVGDGVYSIVRTLATGDYSAVMKTAANGWRASLAIRQVPLIDAAISTRATPADVTITFTGTVAISATEAENVASGLLAIRAYNTFSQAVTSTSTDDLASADKVWLAIKTNVAKTDAQSTIFIEQTDGLTVVNGAVYATTANGTLVVSGSSGAWVITAGLDSAVTSLLERGSYDAEIKYSLSGVEKVLWTGAAVVTTGIVRAIA